MSRPIVSRRAPSQRLLLSVLIALLLVAMSVPALAQVHRRGFVPPDDYEEQLEARRVWLPMDKGGLPSNWDWRDHEGTTPVKDQADCGSCWAFAATGEMEAKIRIYYFNTLNLSEQQMISCNPYGSGCDGGWAGAAYYVFMYYGGVLENCMPYAASDYIACRQDQYLKFTDMDDWVSLANNIDQIKTAVLNNGPVCTGVDANAAWDGYSGGIIDAPGGGVNHLVLIVGWDDRVGDNGVWIIKNSWGAGWGDAGYCYVQYGACNAGSGVTSMDYTPPPVRVSVASPMGGQMYYGDAPITITWTTANETVDEVDLYYGTIGACQDMVIAENVPNTGSYDWTFPNITTDRGTVLVFPSEGTHRGFGFCVGEFQVLGHQTRYVSAIGSNTPPYDTPTKAAHSIQDAVLAGAGRDTIMIASGDYLVDRIAVDSQAHLVGGWNADFTTHDPVTYATRLRGTSGTISFTANAEDYCGVSHLAFADCQGWNMSVPVNGRHGAAVVSVGASPEIVNCIFENNRADPGTNPGWGGAVLIHEGSPSIRDCTFTGNIASHGGALALSECSDALVEACVFEGNANADSTSVYMGAAVYVTGGSLTIRDCELRGGSGGVGGGLAIDSGADVVAEDLVIANNRTMVRGGGVAVDGSSLVLTRSEITNNLCRTGVGGGLDVVGSALTLGNVLVFGNSSPNVGGGLYGQSLTSGTIFNSVFDGNEGLTGGGAFVAATGPFTAKDNTATNNIGGGALFSGAAMDADYNLAYGNTGDDFLSPMGPNDVVADPLYCDAASGDYAPLLHSPLVDTGSGVAGLDWDGSTADRGVHGGPSAVPAGPAMVSGLVGSVDGAVVTLNWDAVEGAAAYTVYRDSAAVFVPSAANVCDTVDGAVLTCQDTPPAGDWYYLVAATDALGHMGGYSARFETSGGSSTPVVHGQTPPALAITGVVPNPFNPRATVSFALPHDGRVKLTVYDLRGRVVQTLHDGDLTSGHHTAVWNGTDRAGRQVATGVYLVRLDDGHRISVRKAVLAK